MNGSDIFSSVVSPLSVFLTSLLLFIPKLFVGVIILGIGLLIASSLKKGVFMLFDMLKLEKMLKNGKDINDIRFSKNGNIRFAPKGTYNLGEQTPEDFAKNGLIIANCEKEGAEKLGEVSTKFKYNPHVWGVETEDKSVQSVSVFGEYYLSDRLYFDGYFGDYGDGHAFGVRK